MRTTFFTTFAIATLTAVAVIAARPPATSISGDYLEVRSCDIYTGPCFANAEMGVTGKEGLLVWSVRRGDWKGVNLAGLSVVAAVSANGTLGDLNCYPRSGRAVLIVDAQANTDQRAALCDLARAFAGPLIREVAAVKIAPMEVALKSECASGSCARVSAGDLVEISTRCLGGQDHLCGNEEAFYPPLTEIQGALPAFTELASYQGSGLGLTWQMAEKRSAYLGTFSM